MRGRPAIHNPHLQPDPAGRLNSAENYKNAGRLPATAFGAIAAAMYLLFPLAHLWLADLNGSGFLKGDWNVGPGWLPILRDVFVYPLHAVPGRR
jgi:hypothetical protein